MIKYLDGLHETPNYRKNAHICLYRNVLFENYPDHWHSPIEVLMPIENSYTAIIENQRIEVKPYEILFIGSNVIHAFEAPESGVRYFFQADISRLRDIAGVNFTLSLIGSHALFTPDNSPDIHAELVKLYLEICEEYMKVEEIDAFVPTTDTVEPGVAGTHNSLYEPIIYAKLLVMIAHIGRSHIGRIDSDIADSFKKKEYIGKFMTVCSYIDEHFAEDLSLEEMAAFASFSKFHFSRLFKQFTGVSFYRYVNQKRIANAEALLINPEIPITQIAIKSGFSSPSAFIRMFKLIKGYTPTEFRKIREQQSFTRE